MIHTLLNRIHLKLAITTTLSLIGRIETLVSRRGTATALAWKGPVKTLDGRGHPRHIIRSAPLCTEITNALVIRARSLNDAATPQPLVTIPKRRLATRRFSSTRWKITGDSRRASMCPRTLSSTILLRSRDLLRCQSKLGHKTVRTTPTR